MREQLRSSPALAAQAGLGFVTAIASHQGAKVAITSTTGRIKDRAQELTEASQAEIFAMSADLCDRARIQVLVDEILIRFERLDIVGNN